MTKKRSNFTKKRKPVVKAAEINKLAETLDINFKKIMPLIPLPDGSIAYKDFIVKENAAGRWVLYRKTSWDAQGEFNLKSSALIAAKALSSIRLQDYNEIKNLDSQYWSNFFTVQVCKYNMPKTTDYNRYLILLDKLEHSEWIAENCKDQISKKFRWSFA
jgi:MoaA/NifB/PqqE/SkfB family radical SAM enzyme